MRKPCERSPADDEEARRLAAETGLAARFDRQQGDIAVTAAAVEAADVVVLHRVVCCYPDYERLRAAVERWRRRLVFSYPHGNPVARGFLALQNGAFSMLGWEYRSFGPPTASHGLHRRGGGHAAGQGTPGSAAWHGFRGLDERPPMRFAG